jgi:NAD(P)-dependent dehydrogenase (short-subunit alcohol dehydrogenase family)
MSELSEQAGRLHGKRAVVVGGGQMPGVTIGNGRATAELFALEGASVLVVDRDLEAAQATAAAIAAAGASPAAVCAADIRDEDDCARIARTATEVLGGVDVLHNNVGIIGADARPTVELSQDTWDLVMTTNLKAMWLVCKHVLPLMRAQRSGAIVNLSSISSLLNGGQNLPYVLSKAGVNSLTTSLALENAEYGIRVNAVLPGLIDTPMAVDDLARRRSVERSVVEGERNALVPLGAMGTAWDIARAALFLASDDAGYITGQLLTVDGGQTLRRG